jgi:hypothetical protein
MRILSILLLLVLVGPQAAGAIGTIVEAAAEDGCGDACAGTPSDNCPPPCSCCPCCFTSPVSLPSVTPVLDAPLLPAPASPQPADVHARLLCSDVFHVPKSRLA